MSESNSTARKPNPRRRRRNKMRVFKEVYLPAIIFILVVVLIIALIVSNNRRRKEEQEAALQASIAAQESLEAEKLRQDAEVAGLILQAQELADSYDYDGAIALLDSFSGNIYDYDDLLALRDSCVSAKDNLVLWSDPNQVVHLGFQVLMVDCNRAFKDKDNAAAFKKNFITTYEFSEILKQLYDNNYILIEMDDLITVTENADGTVTYSPKELYLPEGKKPLMITESQVNYYTYMVDDNKDGVADAKGSGFASRLLVDDNGEIKCEYVDTDGTVKVGNYDMVPILNNFLKKHPDFSYKGAKATLAITGYDGIFGYRVNPEAKDSYGEDFYNEQLDGAKKILQALRDDGYDIACYSYRHINYGDATLEYMDADLTKWENYIAPLLGECDMLVYARDTDIAGRTEEYSGDKYDRLRDAGFRIFIGYNTGKSWLVVEDEYVRQGRLMITGNNLTTKANLFEGIFEAEKVIDPER